MLIINRVQELRKERKMTQDEFAKTIGVSRKTIVSMEKGNYTPSLLLAFQIAEAFDVDINVVFRMAPSDQ